MRILILGAGGVGGYFGGRLIEAGADVTFFLRAARAQRIAEHGLVVKSSLGDFRVATRMVTEPGALEPFDLLILACKAYDLDAALDRVRPAVGSGAAILPLLNGFAHLEQIQRRFPHARVWGGVARISATLAPDGVIHHFGELNEIIFGSREHARDERIAKISALFSCTPARALVSDEIERDLWDKFVLLAALAGMNCLMRASVGSILETPSGERLALQLLAECESVARAEGYSPQQEKLAGHRTLLTRRGSSLKASMLRDIERGGPTEGEHILGDMFQRAQEHGLPAPLLEAALSHVRAYEIERERSAQISS
jgi:2-dehydropantoate 2-reductase